MNNQAAQTMPELPAKWRELAKLVTEQQAVIYRYCADELESALTEAKQQEGGDRLPPEPVSHPSTSWCDEYAEWHEWFTKKASNADDAEQEQDAWTDFECEYLTDGNGYAPSSTYKACAEAWKAAWPDRKAAYAAAVDAYEKCHGTRKSLTQHYAELYRRERAAPQVEANRQTGEGDLQAEIDRLNAIINTPQSDDFLRAVSTEAEHQRQRWGSDHDAGKQPADWFWLVGYLAGKALHAHAAGNVEKAEHHIITTAAALANWHLSMLGGTDMRPGIDRETMIAAAAKPSGGESNV